MAQTLANPNAALPEQRERQLFFWIFIGNALGTGLVGFFDYQSQLTTFWDELGIPCLTLCYLLLRPDEVLSGILDAAILEVTDDACGVLFERHHVRTGSFT